MTKKGETYYYGNSLEGSLRYLGIPNNLNIARDENRLLGWADAGSIKRMKQRSDVEDKVLAELSNSSLSNLRYDSNPVIISIEYNKF